MGLAANFCGGGVLVVCVCARSFPCVVLLGSYSAWGWDPWHLSLCFPRAVWRPLPTPWGCAARLGLCFPVQFAIPRHLHTPTQSHVALEEDLEAAFAADADGDDDAPVTPAPEVRVCMHVCVCVGGGGAAVGAAPVELPVPPRPCAGWVMPRAPSALFLPQFCATAGWVDVGVCGL
jgi:hypothetical protein